MLPTPTPLQRLNDAATKMAQTVSFKLIINGRLVNSVGEEINSTQTLRWQAGDEWYEQVTTTVGNDVYQKELTQQNSRVLTREHRDSPWVAAGQVYGEMTIDRRESDLAGVPLTALTSVQFVGQELIRGIPCDQIQADFDIPIGTRRYSGAAEFWIHAEANYLVHAFVKSTAYPPAGAERLDTFEYSDFDNVTLPKLEP